jgi:malate/lactate dehydrogenase
MKIAIIGIGRVGSGIAYALVIKQFCDHLVIAGRGKEKQGVTRLICNTPWPFVQGRCK